MLTKEAQQTRDYHRKRDPHWGNKINSQDDLKIQAVELLKSNPKGMTVRQLISDLIPYEGQYHIPLPNYLGRLISSIKGTYKSGNKWKYTSKDVV